MYQVTWHHASAFPLETGQLWLNVAANKRNVIPILDFVITQGLQEAAELSNEVRSMPLWVRGWCIFCCMVACASVLRNACNF